MPAREQPAPYTYRMRYPIDDDSLTTRAARILALTYFCEDALGNGVNLDGPPVATLDGRHVYVVAPASHPGTPTVRVMYELTIAELAEAGCGDRMIAAMIGVEWHSVFHVRQACGIPCGRSHLRAVA